MALLPIQKEPSFRRNLLFCYIYLFPKGATHTFASRVVLYVKQVCEERQIVSGQDLS